MYHDREEFEVFAYSLISIKEDEIQQKIASDCDVFRDISSMSSGQAAQQIHSDGLDVLIDLGGYTTYTKPEILALHPAPVQCQFMGNPGTMEAKFIEYVIADRHLISGEMEEMSSQKFVFLPCAFVASISESEEIEKSRSDFGLPDDAFVYCCFNFPTKFEPVIFKCWMEILQLVPESVLWLFCENQSGIENLKKAARNCGISEKRLFFTPKIPYKDYLALFKLANVFLDTHHYNAGSTAIDALRMSLPIITFPGKTYTSRMCMSILNALGLEELVCNDTSHYIQLAVELAADSEKLSDINSKIANARFGSVGVFNVENFTQNLEKGIKRVVLNYREEKPPESIVSCQA